MISPIFTVFTPTYNRAHTLPRVYESLCKQNNSLFEWLVVDDGSKDGTSSLLYELSKISPFPIRVIYQVNGGKHRAHNTAIKSARGELTVILDSDDELVPDALTFILDEWNAITNDTKTGFAGILGHSTTPDGEDGASFSKIVLDGHLFELVASGALVGEKLPCYLTSILKDFPFPEKIGCNGLVPEGTVWLKIGEKYKVRCIKKSLRIYHRDENDSISLMNSYKNPASNAWGLIQSSIVVLNLSNNYWPRFFVRFAKASINCTRYSLHSHCGIFYPIGKLNGVLANTLWFLAIPLGIFIWTVDLIRIFLRAR